tara:strand:- start:3235 stop:5745 length:2511 start_codon:yes stop_codon:yes gene_type:complete
MFRTHILKKNIRNIYTINTDIHISDSIITNTLNGLYYPDTDGTANQVLETDGNNTLSWVDTNWIATGNNIHSNNSGYVGILQSNPTTALDVNGTIKLNNHLYFSGSSNQIYYNDNELKFMTNGAWRMTITDDGNIGINDISPSYKLDVDGDINLTGSLRINNVVQILSSSWTESSNDLLNNNSGNVGIGQSNPSYKLDVNGDLLIRGDNIYLKGDSGSRLRLHHSGNDAYIDWYTGKFHLRYDTTNKFTFTSAGNFGILQSNPTTALDVNGTIKLNNHLYFTDSNNQIHWSNNEFKFMTNGSYKMTITDDGNIGINDISPSYKLDVDGDINFTGTLRKNGTEVESGSSPWTESGNNIYNGNSGNVGIGTNNPTEKLDVDGSLFIRGSNIWLKNNADTGTRLRLHHNGTDAYIDWYTGKFHFRYDTTSKFTFTNAGNFGILQSNPTTALDVNGTIKLNNHLYFSGSSNQIYYYSNEFKFMTNGSYRMTINNTGNVGINNTSPIEKLDIDGNIFIRGDSGNIYFKNNQNSGSRLRIHHNGSHAYIDYLSYMYFRFNATTTLLTLLVYYVGINNASPQNPLHISNYGNDYTNSLYGYHHSGSTWGWATYYGTNFSTSGNNLGLRVDEGIVAQRMYIMSDVRIKKDIVDIVDNEALIKLRLLKPKKYKYIDVSLGDNEAYGFIAQEVNNIINNSCTISGGYIPNIQKSAVISLIEEKTCVLTTGTDNGLEINDIISVRDNIGKSFDEIKIIEIIDTKSFRIDRIFTTEQTIFTDENYFTEENIIFIYGKKVNDFHNLNKDSIWTIATAALQEVDRQLQAEKAKVATLEQELIAIKIHLGL